MPFIAAMVIFALTSIASSADPVGARCERLLVQQEKKYAAIFSRYIEKRLRNLEEKDRQAILARLAKSRIVLNDQSHIYGDGLESVYSIPQDFRGTFLLYLLLAHETEHLIQFQKMGFVKGLLKYKYQPSVLHQMEQEAMQAEWDFLQLVPDSAIDEILHRLGKSKLSPEDQRFFRRIFADARLDKKTYIRRQHQMGRYNHENALMLSLSSYLKAMGLAGLYLGCAGLASVLF